MTARRPLQVFAPGSLAPVRDALIAGFAEIAPDVEVTFCRPAYSGVLAAAIAAGAPADVFISANRRYMDELNHAGLVMRPAALAGNALCLVVRADLAGSIRSLAEALAPGRRLLLPPTASDPLGEYTEQMLIAAGFADLLAAKRSRGEVVADLKDLPAILAARAVDAAVLYCTAVPGLGAVVRIVPLPAAWTWAEHISFAVGAIKRDGTLHPAAPGFIDYLLAPAAQAVLLAAGFRSLAQCGTWPDPAPVQ